VHASPISLFSDAEFIAWFALEAADDDPGAAEDDSDDDFAAPVRCEPLVFHERVDLARIALLESEIARLQGEQVAVIAGFVHDYAGAHEHPELLRDYPTHARDSAYAEIALALGIAPRTSDSRVGEAIDLVERLPEVVAALRAGRITLPKARAILHETLNLPHEQLTCVQAEILPIAAGLTPGNLRRAVRRLVEKFDAEAVATRRLAVRSDRWVQLWDLPDGMAQLTAKLPAEKAAEMFGVIDAFAHSATDPADERNIDQLRADALHDLICRPLGAADRIRYEIRVLIPADSTSAESVTAAVLDLGGHRYRPGHRLAEYIRARDQHCRWPGCRQPAHRADIDHTIPFDAGGRTVRSNLALLCRKHHRIKQLPGWSCEQNTAGVLDFTSPAGRTYRTRPPTTDGHEHPVERWEQADDPAPF